MNVLTQDQAADLRSVEAVVSELGVDLIIVGAVAFRAFLTGSHRTTEDIDVALALDLDEFDEFESCLKAKGWIRDPRHEQRWRGPRSSYMDILPVGPELRASGRLVWPRSGMSMSLQGFVCAFRHAKQVELSPGLYVKVVPPPGLLLLKMVAYLDDPPRRIKDLQDIYDLLRSYESNSSRLFTDEVFAAGLPDVEFAPALLLGSDLAALCESEAQEIVEDFLCLATDKSSETYSRLLRHEDASEQAEERLQGRFRIFKQGFERE